MNSHSKLLVARGGQVLWSLSLHHKFFPSFKYFPTGFHLEHDPFL